MKRTLHRPIVQLALLLLLAPVVRGDDAKPVSYLSVMSGPLDKALAFATSLGIPVPDSMQPAGLEAAFPFIGAGGIRPGGSVGMLMGAPLPGTDQPSAVLVIPVNPDAATIANFVKSGAQAVAGTADTVKINAIPFRRIQGFLLFGGSDTDIAGAAPDPIAKRLADGGGLGEFNLDFALWRSIDPAGFAKLLKSIQNPAPADSASKAGQDLVVHFVESGIDRLGVTLSDSNGVIRLRTIAEPFNAVVTQPFPKPAFPADIAVRTDMVYPNAEASHWVADVIDIVATALAKDNQLGKPADAPKTKAALRNLSEILAVADATSIAVGPAPGGAVVYQVNQYGKPANVVGRIGDAIKQLNDLVSTPDDTLVVSTYTGGGVTVTRIAFSKSPGTLDIAESGTTVRIVIAADSVQRLPDLMKLAPDGEIVAVSTGTIDTGKLFALVRAIPASPAAALPPAVADMLTKGLADQAITWKTTGSGKTATLDVDIPENLVKAIVPLLAPAK